MFLTTFVFTTSLNVPQNNAKSKHIFKKIAQSIRMLNLSLKELKLIAKNRDIEGYKSISKNKLLSIINTPEPIIENKTIQDIRK